MNIAIFISKGKYFMIQKMLKMEKFAYFFKNYWKCQNFYDTIAKTIFILRRVFVAKNLLNVFKQREQKKFLPKMRS